MVAQYKKVPPGSRSGGSRLAPLPKIVTGTTGAASKGILTQRPAPIASNLVASKPAKPTQRPAPMPSLVTGPPGARRGGGPRPIVPNPVSPGPGAANAWQPAPPNRPPAARSKPTPATVWSPAPGTGMAKAPRVRKPRKAKGLLP
jgi:hypothetical protein